MSFKYTVRIVYKNDYSPYNESESIFDATEDDIRQIARLSDGLARYDGFWSYGFNSLELTGDESQEELDEIYANPSMHELIAPEMYKDYATKDFIDFISCKVGVNDEDCTDKILSIEYCPIMEWKLIYGKKD